MSVSGDKVKRHCAVARPKNCNHWCRTNILIELQGPCENWDLHLHQDFCDSPSISYVH